ncbi:MAG: hypothetical protein ACTIKT_06990 [Microbacterium sp.]
MMKRDPHSERGRNARWAWLGVLVGGVVIAQIAAPFVAQRSRDSWVKVAPDDKWFRTAVEVQELYSTRKYQYTVGGSFVGVGVALVIVRALMPDAIDVLRDFVVAATLAFLIMGSVLLAAGVTNHLRARGIAIKGGWDSEASARAAYREKTGEAR